MPGFDRSGPMGHGAGTGWGNGQCQNVPQSAEMSEMMWSSSRRSGRGQGFRGGMGMRRRRGCVGQIENENGRFFLEEQKTNLENQLSLIKQRLETLMPGKPDEGEGK